MKAFLSLLVLFTLAQALPGQNFETSTKKGVDLRSYQTFTVVKGAIVTGTDQPVNADVFYDEIKPLIVRELKLKGYTYVDSSAELAATYVVETTVRTEIQNLGPLGQAPASNPAMVNQPQTWSREFRQGTLIINVDDVSRKTTVWSSEGVMDISRTRGGNLLDYAVRNAFRQFPDKKKKSKPGKSKKG
jgi:hypothetical protein